MGFTPEQRQKALETRRRKAEEAKAGSVAVLDPPATEEAPPADDVMGKLAELFSTAASDAKKRETATEEALALLGKLDPLKHPEIADNPTVQEFVEKVLSAKAESPDVKPGTILGAGLATYKKPWTWRDLAEDKVAWVEFACPENIPVTYQGLTLRFRADQPIRCPKPFVDVYQEMRGNRRFAANHAAWLFRQPGAQAHPDMVYAQGAGVSAVKVRATHNDPVLPAHYKPGGGPIADTE